MHKVVSHALTLRRKPDEASQVLGALLTQSVIYVVRDVDSQMDAAWLPRYTSRAAMQSDKKRPTVRTSDGSPTHNMDTNK